MPKNLLHPIVEVVVASFAIADGRLKIVLSDYEMPPLPVSIVVHFTSMPSSATKPRRCVT